MSEKNNDDQSKDEKELKNILESLTPSDTPKEEKILGEESKTDRDSARSYSEINNTQSIPIKKTNSKKIFFISGGVLALLIISYFVFSKPNTYNQIIIPFIAHQSPTIDPHLPSSVPLSDKLDEVLFDGLFNIKATPSGVIYEDGLATLVSNQDRLITIKLKEGILWHNSYRRWINEDEISVKEQNKTYFTYKDIQYTIDRIRRLGSLSPDFVLINQALDNPNFNGPNSENEITFQFSSGRGLWRDDDIKETLSFKIIPQTQEVQNEFLNGTGPFAFINAPQKEMKYFIRNSKTSANIENFRLYPLIDNSTFLSELVSNKINVLLDIPFGARSNILDEDESYFHKSNISTTFFAILFNTQKVPLEKRQAYRALINNKDIQEKLYKIGTQQQRHIVDYKGNTDQYDDYLNFSVFPKTSVYVNDEIVTPKERTQTIAELKGTPLDIKVSLNFGYFEELTEISHILNNPAINKGKYTVTAVREDIIKNGNYDALIIPVSGYRSNYLFDLYSVFLRTPDLTKQEINLKTKEGAGGKLIISKSSMIPEKNFFKLDATKDSEAATFLSNLYGFMSSKDVYDKTVFARMVDEAEQKMALGIWLFSLPSITYFSEQFDKESITLYGVASQLSTIEDWKEQEED